MKTVRGLSTSFYMCCAVGLWMGLSACGQDWIEPSDLPEPLSPVFSQITVDTKADEGPLRRIWNMTGFTPSRILLERPMQIQLAYFGAMPHHELRHVRIHFLLDLIDVDDMGTAQPNYDWTRFNTGIDALVHNGLHPFFELMGNPGNYFAGYDTDAKIAAWQKLVRDTARHCIERYGLDEVRQWYWETINEPDLQMWWPERKNPTNENFCRYYDACYRGLREADEKLIFGAPGNTGLTTSRYLQAMLAHIDPDRHGGNAPGAMPAFISYHMKGGSGKGSTPNAHRIVDGAVQMHEYIRRQHPALAHIPLMNNECDPVVGWSSQSRWRAGPYYPAFMVRVVDLHRRLIVGTQKIPFILLGNDNGFLGDWNQRTLCALLGSRRKTEDGFDLIRQPSLGMHLMLSYLGEQQCAARTTAGGDGGYTNLGAIAAVHKVNDSVQQATAVIYNAADDPNTTGQTPVSVVFESLPSGPWRMAHYRIDAQNGNPHGLWQAFGMPERPSVVQLAAMRRAEEPGLVEPVRTLTPNDGVVEIAFQMPLPGLSVIVLSRDTGVAPPTATALRQEAYTGLDGSRQVVLLWDGADSRFIRTFVVEYAPNKDGVYVPVSNVEFRSRSYLLSRPAAGYYRIRAVDFWQRTSAPSEPLYIAAE